MRSSGHSSWSSPSLEQPERTRRLSRGALSRNKLILPPERSSDVSCEQVRPSLLMLSDNSSRQLCSSSVCSAGQTTSSDSIVRQPERQTLSRRRRPRKPAAVAIAASPSRSHMDTSIRLTHAQRAASRPMAPSERWGHWARCSSSRYAAHRERRELAARARQCKQRAIRCARAADGEVAKLGGVGGERAKRRVAHPRSVPRVVQLDKLAAAACDCGDGRISQPTVAHPQHAQVGAGGDECGERRIVKVDASRDVQLDQRAAARRRCQREPTVTQLGAGEVKAVAATDRQCLLIQGVREDSVVEEAGAHARR
eukprot:scaffold81370_cov30-Tisochrysis_lutea.AAC.5